MTWPSIFPLFLSAILVSNHLLQNDQTSKTQPEMNRKVLNMNRDRKERSADDGSHTTKSLKVLDFSADNDQKPDSNGEYTSATLEAGPLLESFTICSAFMVKNWTTDWPEALMFAMLAQDGSAWSYNIMYAGYYTSYSGKLGPVYLQWETAAAFFPRQWLHVCFSVDSMAKNATMVVDGQLLVEEYRREEDAKRPTTINLQLGSDPRTKREYTGTIAELNIFNSPLSVERMKSQTTAGAKECGAPGDLVNWEEAEWVLHSQAKMIEVDREREGPCKESKVQVFKADFTHQECMHHCQKISGGRSPPVRTQGEWESFTKEVDLIKEDKSVFSPMWLSVTEGNVDQELARLNHWPQTEVVNGVTEQLEAEKTVWRDYYTGERLGNWTKPYAGSSGEPIYDDFYCMLAYTDRPWNQSWNEVYCSWQFSCPCSYPKLPLLRLRGLCSDGKIDQLFLPKQMPGDPSNMVLVGQYHSRIEYNDTSRLWILTDAKYTVNATISATKTSYVLGKYNWTISNDADWCSKGRPYTSMLKLSSCKEYGEFTCDDGQCINMEERCDQIADCRDDSDETGCKLFALVDGYKKDVPPINRVSHWKRAIKPVPIKISMRLLKMMGIAENDNTIDLQFEIILEWNDQRLTYYNLKTESFLNAFTDDEMKTIWLPVVIYANTDQKETTRIGWVNEWTTTVEVSRDGNFTR